MLERLSPDGRLRSRFLCGGADAKVDLFRQWLAVLQGPLVSVTLVQPLFGLMAWLVMKALAASIQWTWRVTGSACVSRQRNKSLSLKRA